MIRAVVFDVGGVLEPNYAILADLAAFLGVPEGAIRDQLARCHGPLNLGTMSLREAYGGLLREGGASRSPDDAVAEHIALYCRATPVVDARVVALIESLKARYTVACLTNTEREVAEANRRRGRFRAFHRVYLSTDLGLRKPDPGIYRHVEADLGCATDQIVFLDDRRENVEGATAVGWQTILYGDFDRSARELSRILGHPLEANPGAGQPRS